MDLDGRIPVICLDPSAGSAFDIFNPNDWRGASRGFVQSCATEFAVLQYSANRIETICASAKAQCSGHFERLQKQWQGAPWDLTKFACFGQLPELHVLIAGFFTGLKSLLDLNAQLISAEGTVDVVLDGFHRAKGVYGGVVINALENNVKKGKEPVAAALRALVTSHKKLWIDDAINSRDLLVHPMRGAQQLMFEIRVESHDGSLVYLGALPPRVGERTIGRYAADQISNVRDLSTSLLQELRKSA